MKKLILLLFIPLVSFGQTPITDANFNQAIWTCLSTNPIDGMCLNSEYGAMPDWDVSQVTNMFGAFSNRFDFNADISNWDVSSVIYMNSMFESAYAFNQPIGNWDVSSVNEMEDMFLSAISFNQPIGAWDVSNVTNMSVMFTNASAFNQPIGDWDFSNIDSTYHMFLGATAFNQPIGSWDMSSVTSMVGMFYDATSFNQDLSSWCVTNIPSEPPLFSDNSPLTESNKPLWGTCPSFGLDDQNLLDISIYPNPSSHYVYVNSDIELEVIVFDLLGKELIRENISGRLDISSLEKGTYILNLTDGINTSTHKIIKE